jgi:hypothetical protein
VRFVLEEEMRQHYPKAIVTKTVWSNLASDYWGIWTEYQQGRRSTQ